MLSTLYRTQLNDAWLLGGSWPQVDTYVALFRTDAFAFTEEVPAGDYARVPVTWGTALRDTRFSFQSLGTYSSSSAATFATQGAAWAPSGTHSITNVAIYDSLTGGEQLVLTAIAPFSTTAGKQIVIAASRMEFFNTVIAGTQDTRKKILEYFLKVPGAVTPPAPTEIGLIQTPANLAAVTAIDAGTYTELSGSGYSRIAVSALDWYHFGGGANLFIRNNVTWFTASGAVAGVLAFFDGSTLLGYHGTNASTFSNSVNAASGDVVRFVGVEDFGSSFLFSFI